MLQLFFKPLATSATARSTRTCAFRLARAEAPGFDLSAILVNGWFCIVWMATISCSDICLGETQISFTKQIRPIISDKCFACHGPDGETREAELRLDQRASATENLGGYAAIVPGKPEKSELVARITSSGADQMPPASAKNPLTEQERQLLQIWVAQGAKYEEHWAYRKLAPAEIPGASSGFAQSNPIDAFLQKQLLAASVPAALPTGKAALAKRVYLDLLGVPPTLEEVRAFTSDNSPDAFEHLVDCLLSDSRYGERMAVFWLDLVRYADSVGYHSDNYMEVSAYRDYVIDSFNSNSPFDKFTAEQLAGDLLPNATRRQLIASGYNRLLQTTEEGGAQPKEYRAIYAADRVRNFSTVWLGATVGCAQCHDHKYDPITTRDFYSMAAFFADIAEQSVGPRDYNMLVPTPEEEKQLEKVVSKIELKQLDRALAKDQELQSAVEQGQISWEKSVEGKFVANPNPWVVPQPTEYSSDSRLKLRLLPDNSILASNADPYHVAYEVTIPVSGVVRSLRLEVMTHHTFQLNGGFCNNRDSFVLSEVEVTREQNGQPVQLASAEAEYEQPGFPAGNLVDGNQKSGWAVAGHPKKSSLSAVIRLSKPVRLAAGERLRVKLIHRSIYGRLYAARFRLSFSSDESAPLEALPALPKQVVEAIQTSVAERTLLQKQQIAEYYYQRAPQLAEWRKQRNQLFQKKRQVENGMQKTLVAETMAIPREVRILPRGDWQNESGEVVKPAPPAFLPSNLPTDRRLTRLDLANWVVSKENPLPARVFVNRVWKLLFGRGLAANLTDFGGQGVPPTHPELLDWLAIEFVDSGWDVKQLVKRVVMSAAYQQSSVPSPEQLARDPLNRLFSRQNRWRLEAEFVRDSVLSISGLLDTSRIGGRSVFPYQPDGYWSQLNFPPRKWRQSSGQEIYRRSMYTFWCRSFLHPTMVAFDAPSREECTAERARSNIPQQALVLLNAPAFVEAARVLADRILQTNGGLQEKAAWAIEQTFLRESAAEEVDILVKLYLRQIKYFQRHPEQAEKLIRVGASEPHGEASELAAWTQVSRALLSAYEANSRF